MTEFSDLLQKYQEHWSQSRWWETPAHGHHRGRSAVRERSLEPSAFQLKSDGTPYDAFSPERERDVADEFQRFYDTWEHPFENIEPLPKDPHSQPGHFTGTAVIVDKTLSKVLLTLHAKLNKWLPLGGHADGNSDIFDVAHREAQEESGLSQFFWFSFDEEGSITPQITPFDCDIHYIPPRPKHQAHLHYDVCFLLVADPAQPIQITNESKDLAWWNLEEVLDLTEEETLFRHVMKIKHLQNEKKTLSLYRCP